MQIPHVQNSKYYFYLSSVAKFTKCCIDHNKASAWKCTTIPAKFLIVKSTAVATFIQNCTRSKRFRLRTAKIAHAKIRKLSKRGSRRHSLSHSEQNIKKKIEVAGGGRRRVCATRFDCVLSAFCCLPLRGASEGAPVGTPRSPWVARWPAPLPQAGRRERSGRTWPARRRSPSSTTAFPSPPPCRPAFGWWTAETSARRRAWPPSSTRRPSTSPSWQSEYKIKITPFL